MKAFKTNRNLFSGGCANFVCAILLIASMAVTTAIAAGPAVVNLGTAGNYSVLACTGISATGVTNIVGDIGVSPYAATAITGFGLIMDASGEFSTSSLVTGHVFAADYAPPTPTIMGVAIGDMQIAYTDAAGRPTPDYTEWHSGDLSGQTLVPGLYKWGTGVLINTDVTFNGGPDDVWILQIAGTVVVGSSVIVHLDGGAKAENIFWQVAGQVTLGTTSQFAGIILGQTAIVIQNGATLDGRALAQTEVTLDGNDVTEPDIILPTVDLVSPLDLAVDVAIDENIVATFSEEMNTASVEAAFSVNPIVAGSLSWVGNEFTFNPNSDLAEATLFTVTIGTGARDLASNGLAANYVWSFTTGDFTPPTVISVSPLDSAIDVAIGDSIVVTFSEAMDTIAVESAFSIDPLVTGVFSWADSVLTFTPDSDLDETTLYEVTISTDAEDSAGNSLDEDYIWSFTTGEAPTVISVSPLDLAIDVAIGDSIVVTFSEAMDTIAVESAFSIDPLVTGVFSWVDSVLTFTPDSDLDETTLYEVTISTDAEDSAGTPLAEDYVWSFTTGEAPTVVSVSPLDLAIDVAIGDSIVVTFSEAMDTIAVESAFSIDPLVTGVFSWADSVMTFTPDSDLDEATLYEVTISTDAEDSAGTPLADDYIWSFTTGDFTPPTVVSVSPLDLAIDVVLGDSIVVTFSESMDTIAVESAFSIDSLVTGVFSWVDSVLTFTPDSDLDEATLYEVTISTDAEDSAGNPLAEDYVWSFTTGEMPTVVSVSPLDMATEVGVDDIIVVTFSELMNNLAVEAAITIDPFVEGEFSWFGTERTFTPDSNLDEATLYTITIDTGAVDLAGNPLAEDYVWSFTTEGMIGSDQPPVDLGTAGNYVVLAKTGVSTTGTTHIIGDVGLSPAAASFLTGFGSLPLAGGGTYSTSPIVDGRLYAADYADPTPADLTVAVLDMQNAYTDAAGRTLPDFTELYSGNITGQTLVPGLYKWGTGVLINAAGVTLTGDADAVWIFQIAEDLTVGSGAIVYLSGGAQPQNIFWQVAGQVNIGTTAQVKGIILCQTLISLNTGASFEGRLLAQTAITFDGNAVTQPGGAVNIDDKGFVPNEFSLSQNYPNPFNPTTEIQYNLAEAGMVSLKVYDIMGKEVATLAEGNQEAGHYSVIFDSDKSLSSGIYFCRMETGSFASVKRLILLK